MSAYAPLEERPQRMPQADTTTSRGAFNLAIGDVHHAAWVEVVGFGGCGSHPVRKMRIPGFRVWLTRGSTAREYEHSTDLRINHLRRHWGSRNGFLSKYPVLGSERVRLSLFVSIS